MLWVGISGVPGSSSIGLGKSTLASQLSVWLQMYGGLTTQLARFADPMKALAALETHQGDRLAAIYQMVAGDWDKSPETAGPFSLLVDGIFRRFPSTPGVKNRRLLQTLGEEGCHWFTDHHWVHLALATATRSGADVVITDDVRFDREVDVVDFHLGIDPSADPGAYNQNVADLLAAGAGHSYFHSKHASETSLTQWPEMTLPPRWTQRQLSLAGATVVGLARGGLKKVA